MRTVLALLLAITASAPLVHAATCEIREEYRQDVVDYDSGKEYFLRQKLMVCLEDRFSGSLCHSYLHDSSQNIFTWNMNFREVLGCIDLTVGNYSVNFGSGLFLGMRRYVSPDPFASKPFPYESKFISPSGSSSPVYSFSGAALACSLSPGESAVKTGFYISRRRRFIHMEDYDEGGTGASPGTINSRISREGPYTEPVVLRDSGFFLGLDSGGYASAGIAAFYGDIEGCGGKSLVWDRRELDNSSAGTGGYAGSAFSFRYGDSNIFACCELGFSMALNEPEARESLSGGYGFFFGARFRQDPAAFLVSFSSTGPSYYAPQSTEADPPGRECNIDISLKAFPWMQWGIQSSFEHRTCPGKNDRILENVRREGLFFVMKMQRFDFRCSLDALCRDENAGIGRTVKESCTLKWSFSDGYSAGLKGAGRHGPGHELSSCTGVFFQGRFRGVIFLGLDCTGYSIGGPAMYSSVMPVENSLASGGFIYDSATVFVIRVSLKLGNIRFSLRYEQFFHSDEPGGGRMEFSGKAIF